tara:strand:- start:19127 stop:20881 length:1755 start_codon:yes stop_codon:yes gene_type:complete
MIYHGVNVTPDQIIDRATNLKKMHDDSLIDRSRFRNILNGGENGIRDLLGPGMDGMDSYTLPAPNLLLSALDRLAQKIGKVPTLDVHITNARDSQRNKGKKDKLERIVTAFDKMQRLDLQLPQVARWLPGYGFAVWVITSKPDANGNMYPCAELRNPYDCFPGYYGNMQEPQELAIIQKVPVKNLIQMYPELKSYFETDNKDKQEESYNISYQGYGESGSWENSNESGEVILEYMNLEGTYILHPASRKILDFVPNPLQSGPAFVVAKRFSFDKLQGQFDQVIGLMASMAKINILSVIAMEDAVFTETNIIGELESGQYRKGRNSINYLSPGSQVVKPVNNLPYQLFESVGRLERQLRVVAGYPVQDDAISPNSFVTGRGLEELEAGVGAMVSEYHTILENALQEVDSKRLELDQKLFGRQRKPISGTYKGASFAENYTPATDIDSNFVTKRKYGAMASFDAPNKIITGLQLLQAGIIDKETMQQEMDGLENLTQINERIVKQKTEDILYSMLLQQSQQGDKGAMMAVVEIYNNPKNMGNILEKYFTTQGEEPSPEEQQVLQQAQAPQQQGPPNLAALLGGAIG